MSNSIALAKRYVPLLDEVYQEAALTAVLDSDLALTREGANANEILVPKMSLQGLADYSRNTGYVAGDATLAWETLAMGYERGRKFSIDAQDNEETIGVAFGKLSGEFIRTKVVPELDAYRFSQYCKVSGALTTTAADLNSGTVVAALDAALLAQKNAEVNGDRVMFVSGSIYNAIKNSGAVTRLVPAGVGIDRRFDTFDGIPVVVVPSGRFYTSVDLVAGSGGGFAKTSGAKALNFVIVERSAIVQYTKNALPKILAPEVNPDADAWVFGYRIYGIANGLANKAAGIYFHKATA
ncbi:conserved hypothetical protein [Gammaproteobacteria bacterium]